MSEQPTTVTLVDAYREACTALGEALVRERFLTQTLERRQASETPPPPES